MCEDVDSYDVDQGINFGLQVQSIIPIELSFCGSDIPR